MADWYFEVLKITFCACLVGSRLKYIFYWIVQALILNKSLFKFLTDLVIFSATVNEDVSSANNFGLDA